WKAMPPPPWRRRPTASPAGTPPSTAECAASRRIRPANLPVHRPAAADVAVRDTMSALPHQLSTRFSMPKLAARVGRAKPSAIMIVAEKAKALKAAGRDVISFSIGVPNFLPGPHVYEAVRKALDNDSGQYGSSRGRDDLLGAFLAHMAA